jgi:hypothetical protein
MDRALVHEAGHAIIALHLGFRVERIEVANGFPRLILSNFDDAERTAAERYLVLAGGIASEQLGFGNHDQDAMGSDQREIETRGGGPITDYVSDALQVLNANKAMLDSLVKRLSLNSIAARAEAQFSSDPDSYEIMDANQLAEIWSGSA